MKYRNSVGIAVVAAGLALSVSACQSNDSAVPGTTPQASSAQQATSAQASAARGSDTASPCHTSDLAAKLGTPQEVPVNVQGELGAAGTHYNLPLIFTNHSTHACVLSGFPGVDLVGPGSTYSLPRVGDPSPVTVAPGASAHSLIYYIDPSSSIPPGERRILWTPTTVSVTPPNETTQLSVPWTPSSPVDNADKASGAAAAHIGPIQAGA
ncbi:DUF4232 domain-containing protein [Nocardia macrotermitis]|uniref:DUF4232 domain-containing protein n=1 Tax=Nocardia macrotermitis TaxID=2585198 RepID=A0A7K0DAJ8_9NOCA|nr:DUF4232 domain-containing protein [Nocardia macrotermitis]MQY22806.1 hypothetical protein [Nocardia macrotermitis]